MYRAPLPSVKIGEGAYSPIFTEGRGGGLYTGFISEGTAFLLQGSYIYIFTYLCSGAD